MKVMSVRYYLRIINNLILMNYWSPLSCRVSFNALRVKEIYLAMHTNDFVACEDAGSICKPVSILPASVQTVERLLTCFCLMTTVI